MKSNTLRTGIFAFVLMMLVSCGAQRQSGTAADNTGANGATNGNGKIPK